MDIETLQQLIALGTGLIGLISAGVSAYFAVKNFIAQIKDKKGFEIWNLIMTIADAAMKEAEASGKAGEDKKQMVIDSVKAGCFAAGIDIAAFIDQLDAYIDDTIAFVNSMKKSKKN